MSYNIFTARNEVAARLCFYTFPQIYSKVPVIVCFLLDGGGGLSQVDPRTETPMDRDPHPPHRDPPGQRPPQQRPPEQRPPDRDPSDRDHTETPAQRPTGQRPPE